MHKAARKFQKTKRAVEKAVEKAIGETVRKSAIICTTIILN